MALDAPVSKLLHDYLFKRDSDAKLIFVEDASGQPVRLRSLQSLWNGIYRDTGITCGPNVLYHTHLHLLSEPRDLETVRKYLFHQVKANESSAQSSKSRHPIREDILPTLYWNPVCECEEGESTD